MTATLTMLASSWGVGPTERPGLPGRDVVGRSTRRCPVGRQRRTWPVLPVRSATGEGGGEVFFASWSATGSSAARRGLPPVCGTAATGDPHQEITRTAARTRRMSRPTQRDPAAIGGWRQCRGGIHTPRASAGCDGAVRTGSVHPAVLVPFELLSTLQAPRSPKLTTNETNWTVDVSPGVPRGPGGGWLRRARRPGSDPAGAGSRWRLPA